MALVINKKLHIWENYEISNEDIKAVRLLYNNKILHSGLYKAYFEKQVLSMRK